ncbi:MAG: hypothetical protein L0Z62_31220, partial [Gemmataceae bacterium]|nr:hypothetical protein [Gemmataceae bacterium]
MPAPERSFRQLLPDWVFPVGTQVVLKIDKPLPDGTGFRPRGSVAVVAASPADNSAPYTLRFADGLTLPASFAELAIRRRELDEELVQTADLRP